MGKIFWAVIVFVLIGGWIIYSSNSVDFEEPEGRKTFFGKFASWLVHVGKNIGELTGKAIEQTWLPETEDKSNSSDYIEPRENIIIIED